jgi:hypothetical protein
VGSGVLKRYATLIHGTDDTFIQQAMVWSE